MAKNAATLGCYLGAVAAAAVVGYADLHNTDVQVAVILAGGAAFVLGYVRPQHAWPLAIIVGAGVPVAHWYARRSGIRLPYTVNAPISTLLAFVPAFAGAGTALGLRRLIVAHRETEDED